MKKGFWLVLICLVWISPSSFADYYLKFETSGASHDHTTTLASNTNAWIKLSIVDSYPTDGPVHFENSQTGAFTKVDYGTYEKTVGVDYTSFYVADVPRSITVLDKSDGSRDVISFGDSLPKHYAGPIPAFILPDGLLVTTGLSMDFDASSIAVYIAATMGLRKVVDTTRAFGQMASNSSGPQPNHLAPNSGNDPCFVGWAPSSVTGDQFVMMHGVSRPAQNDTNCITYIMAEGKISHAIRFE